MHLFIPTFEYYHPYLVSNVWKENLGGQISILIIKFKITFDIDYIWLDTILDSPLNKGKWKSMRLQKVGQYITVGL